VFEEILIGLIGVLIGAALTYSFTRRLRDHEYKYREYTTYLKKLEEISRMISFDRSERLNTIIFEFSKSIQQNSAKGPELYLGFSQKVMDVLKEVRQSFLAANNELTGLRLIGSDAVVALVDEFQSVTEKGFNHVLAVLGTDLGKLQENQEDFIAECIHNGRVAKDIKSRIEQQMRTELKL